MLTVNKLEKIIELEEQLRTEYQDKLDGFDAAGNKRAKTDPYWSQLISDDYRPPRSSLEANTLRQFRLIGAEISGARRR